MLKTLFVVATTLILSAGSALAEPAQVEQQTRIASTHVDIRDLGEIGDRLSFATKDRQYPREATGAHATQPTASYPEPESISGGTEP